VQDALEIAAAVKYSDDDNFPANDFECYRCSSLKSYCAQPRTNVVTARSPGWKSFERRAGRLKPVDISPGGRVTGSFCDKSVEVE
jgi:hypothetical protein